MDRFIYKYAVVIGIDGMGNFNKDTDTPNIDRIFGSGASTFYGFSMYPTISAQNWGAMILGTSPEVHGLTNNIVGNNLYTNELYPSLFKTIRKAYPDDYLCSCCNWDPINHGIIEHDLGVDMYTASNDDDLCGIIEDCIAKKPKFLFIQLDDVDGAGHGHGYGTQGHLDQIKKTDDYVGRICGAYEKAGIADDTLFVIIADHGGNDRGHGGYTVGEKFIYFAAAGKSVRKAEISHLLTRDVNAVIRYAFGLEIPEYNAFGYSSQVPSEIFADYSGEYISARPVTYEIKNEATPDINGDDGLLSYFDSDDIRLALFFDNSEKDELSKVSLKEHGHIKYYSGGRYGSMGELGATGFLTADDVKFGKSSFSVSFWMKLDPAHKDNCYVCSTKAVRCASRGFTIALTNFATVLCLENDDHSTYDEIITPFADEISDGWIHTVYSIDRENNAIRVYHNFRLSDTKRLYEDYDMDFDNLPFTVGNDCSLKGNNEYKNYIFNIDDFIVFDKAFDDDSIGKLAAYYKIK